MAKTIAKRWKRAIILGTVMLGLLVAFLAMTGGDDRDLLARMASDINSQGFCVVSEASGVEIRAQAARMEGGCLVLYGGGDSGEASYVHVSLGPGLGAAGTCSARSVSIYRMTDPAERLKLIFHEPRHLPRHMVGHSCYIPLPRSSWLRGLVYDTRARMSYILRSRQKRQGTSP